MDRRTPDGEVLARIEADLARTDPGLVDLYARFEAGSLRSMCWPALRWQHTRYALASIIMAVVVIVAIIAAIFAAQAGTCPLPGSSELTSCARSPASCPPRPLPHGVPHCPASHIANQLARTYW